MSDDAELYLKMAEPKPLVCDENLADNWMEFQESFVSWRIAERRRGQRHMWPAAEALNENEEEAVDKFAVGEFVSFLGRDGRGIFRTLYPAPAEVDLSSYYESLEIKEVLKVFDGHCRRRGTRWLKRSNSIS